MGKILANQSFSMGGVYGSITDVVSVDTTHRFGKDYVVEVGFANINMANEFEVILSDGTEILLVFDNTATASDRKFLANVAHEAYIITARLKSGVTSGGPYSIYMDYTISAVHE